MTEYRFVKEERLDFTVWFTEVKRWWGWEIVLESISANYETGKQHFQKLLAGTPTSIRTVICNQ